MSAFKTIKKPACSEYKEMKSKFLSFIYPIHSPEEVKGLVDELKSEYFDARHHCYAWRIDPQMINPEQKNIALYRTNDDREPNNTAGVPILAAIDSNELKNVLIVVVRYFGGIKLGASNLAKAYRQAAQNAVDQAEIIVKVPQTEVIFSFDFAVMGQVNKFLKDNNFTKDNYTYIEADRIRLTFDKDDEKKIKDRLSSIYGITLQ
ncbi:MAG: YigZ family protein [Bacteroidales bacterium]|nr:YigZ family protein [Bacteroidales bacterium]